MFGNVFRFRRTRIGFYLFMSIFLVQMRSVVVPAYCCLCHIKIQSGGAKVTAARLTGLTSPPDEQCRSKRDGELYACDYACIRQHTAPFSPDSSARKERSRHAYMSVADQPVSSQVRWCVFC